MTKILAMFPGQGSQFVGMGKKLVDNFPFAKAVYEEAEDAAKIKIRDLCWQGPESDLQLTANTQPCILATAVATWRVLREEAGLTPDAFAGHSLGEYAALVAAEKLGLHDAAMLVRQRGEAMQTAVPPGKGAMAAVLKADPAQLKNWCEELSSPGNQSVEIANYNSPDQLVVAGHKDAVDRLVAKLREAKIRAVPLPVSAPFHSSLMKPARKAMTPLLTSDLFTSNDAVVIANLTGEAVSRDYSPQHLIEQIDHPVRWTQTLETAVSRETDIYLEVGPGKVLAGLARRTLPKGDTTILETESLMETLEALKRL